MADSTAAAGAKDSRPTLRRSGTPAAHARKLARSAELELVVEAYAEARAELDRELERVGGYVAQARVEHADGAVASAVLELRVPAAELERFFRAASSLGTVLHEAMASSEVTDEYQDAEARLANARRLEQRLLEFASAKTPDVKGLLEVERELARVREEIETVQGRLQVYDDRVALSSLSLRITSRERVNVGEPVDLSAQLGHSLRESARALLGTGRGALLLLAVLAPWLPLLAAAAYLGRRVLRRS